MRPTLTSDDVANPADRSGTATRERADTLASDSSRNSTSTYRTLMNRAKAFSIRCSSLRRISFPMRRRSTSRYSVCAAEAPIALSVSAYAPRDLKVSSLRFSAASSSLLQRSTFRATHRSPKLLTTSSVSLAGATNICNVISPRPSLQALNQSSLFLLQSSTTFQKTMHWKHHTHCKIACLETTCNSSLPS